MMGHPVAGLLLFTCLILGNQGYNLNEDHLGVLEGDGQPDSLFGWALQHFKNELYVGAPGEGGAGIVYRCTSIDTRPSCQQISVRPRPMKDSWFGGSLAASEEKLYACAFRHSYAQYSPQKQVIGKCFESNGNSMTDLIDFSGRWSPRGGSLWKTNGIYGVSVTVSDKSGSLVVGTPITFDNKGMWNNPYISAGSIGLISRGKTLIKPKNQAPWITSDTDTSTMKNTFKNGGYSLATGNFFNGNPKSYIVGAPKSHNYRGSVFICNNCFGGLDGGSRSRSSNVRYPDSAKDLERIGLQIGEGFGTAIAACDITGDGRDDLIVGAPFYSPGRTRYNVGRIHIFQGRELKRVWPQEESTIEPSGDHDKTMNARFGSSVACIGDTDEEGSEEVVVGAPFFDTKGAIFLYRAKQDRTKGLVLSQVIESKGAVSFGMKLSTSKLNMKDFSSKGFAIGAPVGTSSAYIKVRKVPRFTDISRVIVMPRNVDPLTTKQIHVTIRPAIERRTEFSEILRITASAITDSRLILTSKNNKTDIGKDTAFGRELTFTFEPRKPNFGQRDLSNLDANAMNPLVFKLSLEYMLDDCTDSYSKPCPIFDPEDRTDGQKTNKDKLSIKKVLPDQILDFNICKDPKNCLCDITANIKQETKIVAGAELDMLLGNLDVENIGAEPSFLTNLEITLDKKDYMFVQQGNCEFKSNLTSCKLPFLNKGREMNSKRTFPLKLTSHKLIRPDTNVVEINVKLSSTCKNRPEIILHKLLTVNVVHYWFIKAEQDPDQEYKRFLWDEKVEEEEMEESETVELTYTVFNEGPSMSKESLLYAFIPFKPELIENIKVSLMNTECKPGDLAKNQIPPQVPSNSMAEMIVCKNRGDCHVYECKVKKEMEKIEKGNLLINYDFNKKNAKKMEKVSKFEIVTSICTMSHNDKKDARCVDGNKKPLRTTTSFEYIRKTTLDLLIGSWQLLAGIISGIIVFILIFIIFWKCELFKKVRFYDQQRQKLLKESQEMEDQNEEDRKMVEVDGEVVDLRS